MDKYHRGHLTRNCMKKTLHELNGQLKKEPLQNMTIVELAMQRWSGQHSRPFLFGILSDGTMLCYQAYLFEGLESTSKSEDAISADASVELSNISTSRLWNLRFVRVFVDITAREETSSLAARPRITIFKNVGGHQGLFLAGTRPSWFMLCRERLRVHPQVCII